MAATGMTIKRWQAFRFHVALTAYETALRTNTDVVRASLAVYLARRNERDRTAINRVFREVANSKLFR